MRFTRVVAIVVRGLALAVPLQLSGQPANPSEPVATGSWSVSERGPHHRTWSRVKERVLRGDRVHYQTNSYQDLATGMHYWDNGEWLETQELIEPVEGGAAALRGPHKVRFASQINSAGSITLTAPDGKVFRSHPLALYYTDATDGRYELIAQVKDSTATLVSDNELVYPDAFTSFKCDIRFRYTRNGLEQDILLRQSPPSPELFGMRPETTRICVVTEFIEAPGPERKAHPLRRMATADAGGPSLAEPELVEETLDFGAIKAYQGSAFPLGGENSPEPTAVTGKTWEEWEGRTVLVERTDYEQIREFVERLPKSAALLPERNDDALHARADGREPTSRLFPPAPNPVGSAMTAPVLRLAMSDFKQPGFVLDYQMVITTSNFTFRGDTTYYVSNANVTLSGTTTIEGGTVVKFNKNPTGSHRLYLAGELQCLTATHHPAFFVAQDDDSVGEIIAGSTGVPGTDRYANRAIEFALAATNRLSHVKIRNATRAVTSSASSEVIVSHAQIAHVDHAFYNISGRDMTIRNVLVHDSTTGLYGMGAGRTNRVEHLTLHRVANLGTGNGVTNTFLTNCLIISVTNNLTYSGANNAYNISDSGIFQTVGAGAHYLASGSTNRNAGTADINPTLLSELALRTTHPPLVLSNHFTVNTNLAIQAARDADTPDRGYHYDVLDYVASGISVTNATMTLGEGVVLGVYGTSGSHGLRLEDGATLNATGSPLNPCRIVRYNVVQEQANTNWAASSAGSSIADAAWGGSPRPVAQFQFTEWSAPAGGAEHFAGDYNTGPDTAWFRFTHCEFRGGQVTSLAANLAFTNCLFQRVGVMDYSTYSDYHQDTFFGGSLDIDGGYGGHRALNNLFDQTAITANYVTNNYNGYGTNQSRIWSGGANDVILSTTNVLFETGPLGRFYVPTNGPLVNTGSVAAASAGLYHFTTATNQTKEAGSQVDLGFHYVALTNGVLPDYDYDGVADYAEDSNGNGSGDIGETLWLHSDTDYDGRSDGDEPSDGTDPLNAASVTLVRLGHWRFDEGNLIGDEGQLPDSSVSYNIFPPVASWSSNALYIQSTSTIRYREIETNGRPNINLRNGTVRFWFKPDWSSVAAGGSGPANDARLIEVGRYDNMATYGHWVLGSETTGNFLKFFSRSNGIVCEYWTAPVEFIAGRWHQIALSYSPSNTALYFNGRLLINDAVRRLNDRPVIAATLNKINTVGGGIYNYPDAAMRANGFRIGNDWGDGQQAQGQFEELETFNYPLTAQQIAAGFPGFHGASGVTNDLDYDGRSDIIEYQADATTTNDASSVVGGRLGYWRFNGATNSLLGEALQSPLVVSGVSVTPGWSSNALVIPDGSTARVVYRDVETNGWANFNARSGAVRFWFRPNWSWDGTGTDGSFLFLGHPTSETTGRWDFGIKGPGKKVWLRTATNGTSITLFETSVNFISNQWCQIALNYGASTVALYVNGTLITNHAGGITQWPSQADRANGLVIGNNHAGSRPVNGWFDEVETFNRQLTATEIQRSFNIVNSQDSDLNGVPDLLEDLALTNARPFTGVPFAVTGAIEAEQFDAGGRGVAYTNVAANFWTNDYRASGMEITNCHDLGGGYLVNNLHAGDWMRYTLDVKVAQTYAIEPRVMGLGTGGVFHIQFFTNGNAMPYATTGPLTITTTNWTNLTYKMVSLAKGTNVMKVLMTNNASGGYVGKLNYISIYPAWNEGVPVLYETNHVTGLYATNSTTNIWFEATNNAGRIQKALDDLTTNGAVIIPQGFYYVAQKVVDETKSANQNRAFAITKSNVEIRGGGKTNTSLITHNRSTSISFVGINGSSTPLAVARTNVVFRDITLESRPHWVAVADTSSGGYTNRWEEGSIWPIGENHTGETIVCWGKDEANQNVNLLFTNCLFRNFASVAIRLAYNNSNVAVRACDFIMWDGTNGSFSISTTQPMLTTSNLPPTAVGVHVRAGACPNIVMTDCVFNGNPGLTNVNTDYAVSAGDGLFWGQGPGNWFLARNTIINYGLEGIQFNAGPSAAVGNLFETHVSLYSTCALNGFGVWPTVSGLANDTVVWFAGNEVQGGRFGELAGSGNQPFYLHFTGNTVELSPPFNNTSDYPGAAVLGAAMTLANVSGNRLVSGGHGVHWRNGTLRSVVLKNDFSTAAYRGLSYDGTNGVAEGFALLKNLLGRGVSFHLRLPEADAGGFFLWQNQFTNGVTTVNPFTDSAHAPVHFIH